MPREFLSWGKGLPKMVEHQVARHQAQQTLEGQLVMGNEQDNVVTHFDNGLYCHKHKMDDMINLKVKTCAHEDCPIIPSFNFK